MAYYYYSDLNRALRDVEREKIIPSKQEKKENVRIMEMTISALVTAMKNVDPLFRELFKRFSFTGSYYEGTRVGSPSEFDINLVCKLPVDPDDVSITVTPDEPEYVRYKLRRRFHQVVISQWKYPGLESFFVGDYLHRPAFQRWMQSVISKAIDRGFQKPYTVRELKRSQSGPSFIWHIKTSSGKQIDVDFVPVIDGTGLRFPAEIHLPNRFRQLGIETKSFFLVPKPAKHDDYWRFSFAEAEKHLISSDMGCVKLLIKLFKLLREKYNWNKLTSYQIRNFFLLQMEEHPSSYYWRDAEIGNLFMEMLKKFKLAVNQRQLLYYFNRKANLFDKLDEDTCRSISVRITSILMNANSNNLYDYFV